MTDDVELLRRYSEACDEDAFRKLVERHFRLVYSTALRLVGGDAYLAEDVSQSVFTDLARKARAILSLLLTERTVLSGWLHTGARFAAAKAVRAAQCRRAHEQESHQMKEVLNGQAAAPELDWHELRPVLDEAIGELATADRDALLLRFFEGEEFRAIGERLHVTEDAARMRIARGLERLRGILARHGVKTSTAALAGAVSANAVGAAPAGLAAATATASLASAAATTTSSTLTLMKLMTMTKLKVAAVGGLILATAVPVWQEMRIRRLAAENGLWKAQLAEAPVWRQKLEQLQRERDEATNRLHWAQAAADQLRQDAAELPRLRGEIARLRNLERELANFKAVAGSPTQVAARDLAAKVDVLQQRFEERPDKKIPELQLLTTAEWLELARDADTDTEAGLRKAFDRLRNKAKNQFAHLLQGALKDFADAHEGQLPIDLSQLMPYFEPAIDAATLARYELTRTGTVKDVGADRFVKERAPVDELYDSLFEIGLNGVSVTDAGPEARIIKGAFDAYAKANPGQRPTKADQLRPFLQGKVDEARLRELFRGGQ